MEPKTPQPQCSPVEQAFSNDPGETTEMMNMDGATLLAGGVAVEAMVRFAEQNNIFGDRAWEDGSLAKQITQAGRAIGGLACSDCILTGNCIVEKGLKMESEKNASLNTAINLVKAPRWLQYVRSKQWTPEVRETMARSIDELKEALRTGELEPTELEAGYKSTFVDIIDSTQLEELKGVNTTSSAPLEIHKIQSDNENSPEVEVIDASNIVKTGVKPLEKEAAAILYEKLARKITSCDENGNSQIMTPDNILQKIIKRQPIASDTK